MAVTTESFGQLSNRVDTMMRALKTFHDNHKLTNEKMKGCVVQETIIKKSEIKQHCNENKKSGGEKLILRREVKRAQKAI